LLDHDGLGCGRLEKGSLGQPCFAPSFRQGCGHVNPVTSALAVIEPENLIWSAMIGMSGDGPFELQPYLRVRSPRN